MPYSTRYPDLALLLHLSPVKKRKPQPFQGKIPKDVDILYVYGLEESYARALLPWLSEKRERQLVFLEDDLTAIASFSSEALINYPQIHLKYVSDPKSWDLVLEQCAEEFSVDKIEVISTRKTPHNIRLSLLRKTVLWNSLTSETLSSHLLHKNIIPNLKRIPKCSYVNHWKEAFKGMPIIICGAGPSLKAASKDLRRLQNKALIIACGSAHSALSHLGIRPHLGIAIDPNAREFDCLKGCAYRDLPFLFGSRLYPKVFELFDGPYGYIRSGTGGSLESYVEEKLGLDDPFLGYDLGREALSVTTLALSLAHFWGCDPIIFAGIDLAYAQEKHYSEGVPVKAPLNLSDKRAGERVVRRKGAQGTVSTLIKWIMERDTMNKYAKAHPETTFLNSNPGGLGFKHIPYRPLSKFSGSSTNFDEKIQKLMRRTRISAQVNPVLSNVKKSLQRCLKLFQLLHSEKKESGKTALYLHDLEEEIAYQLVLGSSQQALERIGKIKDPSSLEKEKWKFLEEATRGYLESF